MAKSNGNGRGLVRPLAVEEKAPLNVSIDKSVLSLLETYCQYLNSPRPYVVQQMLT